MTNLNDQRRAEKLQKLLDRLRRGEIVQNRDLQTWLTAEAWAAYECEVQTQKQLRQELKDKPAAVREYEQRIAKANFAYNKGEGFSSRGKHAQARANFAKADQLYERALEHLKEIVGADPSLRVWFDRDTSWTADGELGLSPTAVPLVVTSRSLDNRGGGIMNQIRSNRDVKIAVVEQALAETVFQNTVSDADEAESKEKLRDFISKLSF